MKYFISGTVNSIQSVKKNYSCEQVYVLLYELNKFFLRVNWHNSEYSALHRCICA